MSACVEQAPADVAVRSLRLPARSSELGAARRYAEEVASAFGLDSCGCYELAVAVNEAVTNAITHGAPDGEGQIHLSVLESSNRLTFEVCDYGTFTAPVATASPTCEHGRGFILMSTLTDAVEVFGTSGRTTVRLTKLRA
ncbi:MAG TPA: ATP-binding protein [Solirubrobacteraceae bacterium]|nr:ATP-binding protein [Solirubrobacteraceae bacterium]